jgi:holliday junction DNA helicase RuvA
MITFLQGQLVEKQPTRAVLDVGGVGYEVTIPLSSYDRLPAPGAACRILTYDHVREDIHQLFGFMSEAERRMFVLLMATSGIGPKLAMCALSGLSVRELKAAIVEGDTKRLSSVSGIGKKLAERMVVELRDRISQGEALEAIAGGEELSESDTKIRDAILALISLGYKQAEARKMAGAVVKGGELAALSVEDIVRKALGGAAKE